MLANVDIETILGSILIWLVPAAIVIGTVGWIIALLRRPLRDRHDAEVLLDIIESSVREGRSIEHDLLDLADAQDQSLGSQFFMLCTWLRAGETLATAFRKTPGILPPPIRQMLIFGLEKQTLEQVIPVCRLRLTEADSKWRAALSVVAGSGAGAAFFAVPIVIIYSVFVFPKFEAIAADMAQGNQEIAPLFFAFNNYVVQDFALILAVLFFLNLWIFTGVVPAKGFFPRLEWMFDRIAFLLDWLPWNRLRRQRDLTSLIAIFLDAGIPEDQALAYAGTAVGDRVMQRHIETARKRLREGSSLPEALEVVEKRGGFRWRLRNLADQKSGFADSLAVWHRSLEAKATFKEQAAVQICTTGLILLTGLLIGSLAAGICQMLTGFIHLAAAPW